VVRNETVLFPANASLLVHCLDTNFIERQYRLDTSIDRILQCYDLEPVLFLVRLRSQCGTNVKAVRQQNNQDNDNRNQVPGSTGCTSVDSVISNSDSVLTN
jgi:hypothetical protein